VKQTMVFGEV